MSNLTSHWRSPSNIALVKYWGKFHDQIPANPSISFTLDECYTQTSIRAERKTTTDEFSFDISLDGQTREEFRPKIQTFFKRIAAEAPWLKDHHLVIQTQNSFPHSSGIASSASGMSALALCLLDMEEKLTGVKRPDFYRQASSWSRLGSGSASRSVYGGLVEWGRFEGIAESSDQYAVPYRGELDAVFEDFRDFILLVETGSKTVSSSAGHGLMNQHPYAKKRFEQAHINLRELQTFLAAGDLQGFGELVESEALTLHAMMMTSRPYFILMKPNTLEIIEKIWRFRREAHLPVYFTLDAGANIHLLFPNTITDRIDNFVTEKISPLLKDGRYIRDRVGSGPVKQKYLDI